MSVHLDSTVRLSQHARERCAEMHVDPSTVRWVVEHPDVVRPAEGGAEVCTSDLVPEFAVVYDATECTVVTVLWRTSEEYRRCGETWEPVT